MDLCVITSIICVGRRPNCVQRKTLLWSQFGWFLWVVHERYLHIYIYIYIHLYIYMPKAWLIVPQYIQYMAAPLVIIHPVNRYENGDRPRLTVSELSVCYYNTVTFQYYRSHAASNIIFLRIISATYVRKPRINNRNPPVSPSPINPNHEHWLWGVFLANVEDID